MSPVKTIMDQKKGRRTHRVGNRFLVPFKGVSEDFGGNTSRVKRSCDEVFKTGIQVRP